MALKEVIRDTVKETLTQLRIDEEHPLYPSSPYAASKVAADKYCYSYWNTYHLPIAIIRPFNTYGPRMAYDDGRVVPNFVTQAIKNENLTILHVSIR